MRAGFLPPVIVRTRPTRVCPLRVPLCRGAAGRAHRRRRPRAETRAGQYDAQERKKCRGSHIRRVYVPDSAASRRSRGDREMDQQRPGSGYRRDWRVRVCFFSQPPFRAAAPNVRTSCGAQRRSSTSISLTAPNFSSRGAPAGPATAPSGLTAGVVGVSEAMKARDGYDLLLTALFCAYLLAVRRRGRGFGPKIPEGDLLVPALSLLGSTGRLWASRLLPGWKALGAKASFGMGRLYDGASPRALNRPGRGFDVPLDRGGEPVRRPDGRAAGARLARLATGGRSYANSHGPQNPFPDPRARLAGRRTITTAGGSHCGASTARRPAARSGSRC